MVNAALCCAVPIAPILHRMYSIMHMLCSNNSMNKCFDFKLHEDSSIIRSQVFAATCTCTCTQLEQHPKHSCGHV